MLFLGQRQSAFLLFGAQEVLWLGRQPKVVDEGEEEEEGKAGVRQAALATLLVSE